MTATAPDHFSEIKRVFLRAIREPPGQRVAVLAGESTLSPLVRQEVDRLLQRRRQARGFLRKAACVSVAPFQGNARFEVKRKLGSGGFGDVYQAFDRHLETYVALKVLRQFGPASLHRFKDEFRSLRGVSHPNLVQLYELIFDPDSSCWFFTMEFVDGLPFLQAVADVRALRPAMRGLATGIHALHQLGIVHCDIKPSNVLITRDGRVVLLDFGLARRSSFGSRRRTLTIAGTPDYVAPEQISGGKVSCPADWYSAGIVLYQALTGRLPYEGNAFEVITRKQHEDPVLVDPSPGQMDLMNLCRRLIRCDPSSRLTGEEILPVLSEDQPLVERPEAVREPNRQFFGRVPELHALQQAFEDSQAGETISVHVFGTSGIGKTALIHHFLAGLQECNPDPLLLCGKCHEGESVPYKALDEIVDSLGSFLDDLPPAELDAVAPRNFSVLSKLFPVLDQTAAMVRLRRGVPAIVDSRALRHFAFNVFRELLARIADRRPVVVFIDDLQWGDLDSALLLQQFLEGPDSPRILFVLAYRREDAAECGTIQSLLAATLPTRIRRIDLDRLSESETLELTRSIMARAGSETEIEEIARESEGSPFFAKQLAHYVREGNTPPRVEAAILDRVHRLPPAAQSMLEVVAVAGAPISLATVREVARIEGDPLPARSLLVSQSLVRIRSSNQGICETYHDRVRESVIASIQPDARRAYHERLAIALESQAAPEVVAIHYREAGRFEDAGRYAKQGADQAMSVLAFDRAARLYASALEWTEGDAAETAYLERRRGDALAGWGRGLEAARAYERAAAKAPGDVLPLRIRCAAELLRSGEVQEGLVKLRSLLSEHRLPYPQGLGQIVARLLWERARLTIRGWNASQGQANKDLLDRMDVCWAAAIGTGMVDPGLTEVYCAIHLRLALDVGEPVRLTLALGAWASRLSYQDDGHLKKARDLMDRAEELLRRFPQAYSRGFTAQMWSIIELLGGNWRASQDWAQKALEIYRTQCTGVAWEIATATNFLFTTRSLRGCWAENQREMPALAQEARERGDRYAEVSLRIMTSVYSCYIASDQPAEGEAMIDEWLAAWPHERFDMQKLSALTAMVEFDLYRGNAERAWNRIQASWPETNRSGPLMLTMFRNFTEAQRGRAALALAAITSSERRRKDLIRVARKMAEKLEKSPARYAAGLALLLRAGLAGIGGNRAETRRLLELAEGELESSDLTPWLAITRLRLADLQQGEQAERSRQAAMEWMEAQQVRRPECLAKILLPCV